MGPKKQIRRKSKKRSKSPQQIVKSIPNMGNEARLKHGQPPNQHAYRAPGQSKPLLVFSPLSVKQVIPSSPRTNFLAEQYQRNQQNVANKQYQLQDSLNNSNSIQASQTIKSGYLFRPINSVNINNNNSASHQNGSHSTLQQMLNSNINPYTETVSFRQNSLLQFNSNQPNHILQSSVVPGRDSSLLDPSPSRAPSPIQLTPTYNQNKAANQFPSPNITIVETPGIYNKTPSKTKPIEIPMMRVQAQKHRSKILLQNYESGSHIKVVMGSHTSSAGQKKMSIDQGNMIQASKIGQQQHINIPSKSPSNQQQGDESQIGIITNTSGTTKGGVFGGAQNRGSLQMQLTATTTQMQKGTKQSLFSNNQAGDVDKLEIQGKGGMLSRRSSSGRRNFSVQTQQQQHSSRETPGRNIVFSMTKQSIDSK